MKLKAWASVLLILGCVALAGAAPSPSPVAPSAARVAADVSLAKAVSARLAAEHKTHYDCRYVLAAHGNRSYALVAHKASQDSSDHYDYDLWQTDGAQWVWVDVGYTMIDEAPDMRDICQRHHLPADVVAKFGTAVDSAETDTSPFKPLHVSSQTP